MNGKQAKRIRKAIYGDFSSHYRKYIENAETGVRRSDIRRQLYQLRKKERKRNTT